MINVYSGFFPKMILSPISINEYFFQALKTEVQGTLGIAIGEAVFDRSGTGTGLGITASADALNDRKLSVTGSKYCMTDNGALLLAGSGVSVGTYTSGAYSVNTRDPDWYVDIPFPNNSGDTYYVYIGETKFPVDVGLARDMSRGYSVWSDAVGWQVTPDSVVLVGDGAVLKFDAVLTALDMEHWLTANTEDEDWSRDCVVWLDTDVTGVTVQSDDPSVAICFAKMVKDPSGGGWKVILSNYGDGKLGQTTPSTTTAMYKVAILGPLITNTNTLQSSSSWVFIGTTLSGVGETISTAGQAVTVAYASYAAGFSVEHNSLSASPNIGRHLQVTAEADDDLLLRVDSASDKHVIVRNIGAGLAIFEVEDEMIVPSIHQTVDLLIDIEDATARHQVWMKNSGAGFDVNLVVYGSIETSTNEDGLGDIVAGRQFRMNWTGLVSAKYESAKLMTLGATTAGGVGALQYANGGGTSVPYVHVIGSIVGVITFTFQINPPLNFLVTQFEVHQLMSAAGAPSIRVAIGRWDYGATGIVNVTGWQACSTKTGAFATDVLSLGAGYVLNETATSGYHLMVEITNDGIAISTALVHRILLTGVMSNMPTFSA